MTKKQYISQLTQAGQGIRGKDVLMKDRVGVIDGLCGVIAEPFTMCLAPGDLSEEELLKKAGNGVYIDFLGGLHAGADPISGDFSLQSAGFMIENGVKTKAVKSFTVAGNFYDLLKGVEAVSDTAKYTGFGGVTAFASPAVLVSGLTVAGK